MLLDLLRLADGVVADACFLADLIDNTGGAFPLSLFGDKGFFLTPTTFLTVLACRNLPLLRQLLQERHNLQADHRLLPDRKITAAHVGADDEIDGVCFTVGFRQVAEFWRHASYAA